MDDLEACIAHLRFPVAHRRAIRTTSLLERLFVEERWRHGSETDVRCRSVKVSEFERWQLAAVRKEGCCSGSGCAHL
jgi:putative transposase